MKFRPDKKVREDLGEATLKREVMKRKEGRAKKEDRNAEG